MQGKKYLYQYLPCKGLTILDLVIERSRNLKSS